MRCITGYDIKQCNDETEQALSEDEINFLGTCVLRHLGNRHTLKQESSPLSHMTSHMTRHLSERCVMKTPS